MEQWSDFDEGEGGANADAGNGFVMGFMQDGAWNLADDEEGKDGNQDATRSLLKEKRVTAATVDSSSEKTAAAEEARRKEEKMALLKARAEAAGSPGEAKECKGSCG